MRERFVIYLSGTPGVGKSTVSNVLKKKWDVIELNEVIKSKKLYSGYDNKRSCWIADMKKVKPFVAKQLMKKKKIIVDSHISHDLQDKLVDSVIVLRCDPKVIKRRMKKKGWNKFKITENSEAEYIGLIAWEARRKHKNVSEIDTTKLKPRDIAKIVEKIADGKVNKYRKKIDWIK